MGLRDRLKEGSAKARELTEQAKGQADDAGAKARAKSRAGVQFSKGDTSFSAGAEAGAGSEADARHGDDDQLERLERLSALHASGEISDEEFAASKRKILEG